MMKLKMWDRVKGCTEVHELLLISAVLIEASHARHNKRTPQHIRAQLSYAKDDQESQVSDMGSLSVSL